MGSYNNIIRIVTRYYFHLLSVWAEHIAITTRDMYEYAAKANGWKQFWLYSFSPLDSTPLAAKFYERRAQ